MLRVRTRENQAAARSAQGLVGGAGHHIGDGHRVGVEAGGDQSRHMRHVHEQVRAHRVGDGAETREVDEARIGREAGDDHLGSMFLRQPLHLVVVDLGGIGLDAVLHGLEQLAGEIDLGAMREVAAMIQAHAENGVAGAEQRQVDGGIRLRTGMRLHVGIVGTEQLLGAVDGQLFDHVDVFAAAVVALAGISFGVLVGQYRPLRLQHPGAGVVFRGDELNVVLLASPLPGDGLGKFGIKTGNRHRSIEHERETSRKIAANSSRSRTFCGVKRRSRERSAPRRTSRGQGSYGCSRRPPFPAPVRAPGHRQWRTAGARRGRARPPSVAGG